MNLECPLLGKIEVVPDRFICSERERLSKAVAIAKQAVYQAKAEADAVIRQKGDPVREIAGIAAARAAEQELVAALEKHRREHGC